MINFPPKLHEEADEFEDFKDNPLDKLDRWNYDWLPEYEDEENEDSAYDS